MGRVKRPFSPDIAKKYFERALVARGQRVDPGAVGRTGEGGADPVGPRADVHGGQPGHADPVRAPTAATAASTASR